MKNLKKWTTIVAVAMVLCLGAVLLMGCISGTYKYNGDNGKGSVMLGSKSIRVNLTVKSLLGGDRVYKMKGTYKVVEQDEDDKDSDVTEIEITWEDDDDTFPGYGYIKGKEITLTVGLIPYTFSK